MAQALSIVLMVVEVVLLLGVRAALGATPPAGARAPPRRARPVCGAGRRRPAPS